MEIRPPSMSDVADEAGVSQTTVSLVLNDVEGSGIAQSTKERVRAVADKMGYRHNAVARSLKLQRSDTIGFVSDQITTTPYAFGLVQGAQDAVRNFGKHLLISNVEYTDDVSREAAEEMAVVELLERRVDGIIFASMFHRSLDVPTALSEVPSVLLDVEAADGSLASIVPDEYAAARAACQLLLDAGHTEIVHLSTTDATPSVSMRRLGFTDAMTAAGLVESAGAIVETEDSTPEAYDASLEILKDSARPTAIFCYNDEMAWGVYQAAVEAGLSVPNGLSVVGFKNVPLIAPMLRPGLTTVELPHYSMAQWAVQYLFDGRSDPVQEVVECPVVVRDSVSPPRSSGRDKNQPRPRRRRLRQK
jgi:LacI family transcriptional regulator